MLTVVYLSIPQHKLVILLLHVTFTDTFSVGVVRRDKVKWHRADLTAFTVSQQHLISCDKPHLNLQQVATPNYVSA